MVFPTRLNLELLELNKTVEDAMAVTADRGCYGLAQSKPIDGNDDHRIMTIPEAAGYGSGKFLVDGGKISPIADK